MKSSTCKVSFSSYNTGRFVDSPEILTKPPRKVGVCPNFQSFGSLTMSKLLDQVRDEMRTRHYSYRTEQTYLHWIKQFIVFHDKQHPSLLGSEHIAKFLTYLAVERTVAASTQPSTRCITLPLSAGAPHRTLDRKS